MLIASYSRHPPDTVFRILFLFIVSSQPQNCAPHIPLLIAEWRRATESCIKTFPLLPYIQKFSKSDIYRHKDFFTDLYDCKPPRPAYCRITHLQRRRFVKTICHVMLHILKLRTSTMTAVISLPLSKSSCANLGCSNMWELPVKATRHYQGLLHSVTPPQLEHFLIVRNVAHSQTFMKTGAVLRHVYPIAILPNFAHTTLTLTTKSFMFYFGPYYLSIALSENAKFVCNKEYAKTKTI